MFTMAQEINKLNKNKNKRGIKHGMVHFAEYTVWSGMKSRCNNKNCEKYPIYGGRGITYDKKWESFENFINDVGQRPSSKHTLDRIDTNGNYNKENVRWVTNKENCRNKRNNTLIKGKTLSEWSEILNIKRSTLSQRYYVYGWSVDRVLSV